MHACGVAVCGVRMTHAVLGVAVRPRHRAREGLTSDVLAALYVPDGQAEQPEVQPESQEESNGELQVSQPALQPASQRESQLLPKPSQLWSQLASHESSQLEPPPPEFGHVYASLRARRPHTRQHTVLNMGKRAGSAAAGRPAAGATRRQLPPSAPRAVDFICDRRVVRRERLAVRWEHPAVGCGEHHREVDEPRKLWSLHLFCVVVHGC